MAQNVIDSWHLHSIPLPIQTLFTGNDFKTKRKTADITTRVTKKGLVRNWNIFWNLRGKINQSDSLTAVFIHDAFNQGF